MHRTSDKRRERTLVAIFQSSVLLLLLSAELGAEDAPCGACHAKIEQIHAKAPHGKSGVSCVNCHGDDPDHVNSLNASNIRKFSGGPTTENTGLCTGCHSEQHEQGSSAHSAAGIDCGSCHSIHAQGADSFRSAELPVEYEQVTAGSSVCFDCHQESFAQFEFNERHRLAQGVVACTSCHDPHNPRPATELGGFNQSVCGECHADVEGPFVFEHAAARIEGCAACHEPHGSPNRHLLKIQEVGALCYSCHADVPQFHVGFSPAAPPRFDESTVCTNCHVTIHGSNLDRLFLR